MPAPISAASRRASGRADARRRRARRRERTLARSRRGRPLRHGLDLQMGVGGRDFAEAERGTLSLDDPVLFTRADIISHSPVLASAPWMETTRHRTALPGNHRGQRQWCRQSPARPDRRAGKVDPLLPRNGDAVTRPDRTELELNTNLPGDPRDTRRPRRWWACSGIRCSDRVLGPASRARLTGWMEGSTTGRERLRAGPSRGLARRRQDRDRRERRGQRHRHRLAARARRRS